MKYASFKVLSLVILLGAISAARAQTTINASSCSASAVQTALNEISANGTTIVVPSGTCTWTSSINFSTSFTFTLQGQSSIVATNGQGNPTSFTDSTLIIDGQSGTGGNSPVLSISLTGSSSQVVRVTGLSIKGGNVVYNGELTLNGATGQARLDHSHFININDLAVAMYQPMSGVADHNLFDAPTGSVYNGVRIYNEGGTGLGDAPWAAATGFGSSNFIFLENNTFNNGFMNDCDVGGTFVARYNTFNVTAPNQNIGIQTHATGSQTRTRACRAWEVYGNVIGGGGGSIVSSAGFLTSGTGLWWGNTVGNTQHDIAFDEDRDNNNTYPQTATPNGWGYCGSNFNGVASNWDENSATNTGYACLDQIGRGKGDLLSGTFPKVQNNTNPGVYTGTWPHQALEPVYIWMETYSGSGSIVTAYSPNNNIQANRDYYIPATPFNGTSGTGYGLSSAMPGSCTTGVAYWAADKNQLFTCTATNNWTPYYTPYTYPHPLDTTSGAVGSSPSAPVSLKAVVN